MLSFSSSLSITSDAFVVFVTDKYEFISKNDSFSKTVFLQINSFIKSLKAKKNSEEINSIDITDKKKCFIVKISNNRDKSYFEEIGGKLFTKINNFKNINSVDIFADILIQKSNRSVKTFSEFIFGFNLKSYTFNKYKTLNKNKLNKKIIVKIISSNRNKIENNYKYFNAVKEGVFLARDLVSEPPNVLNPKKYVQEIKKLTRYGLKIKIYMPLDLVV